MNTRSCPDAVSAATAERWFNLTPASQKKVSVSRQSFQFLLLALLALTSYLLVSRFVFQSVQVVGVSMNPTLHDSDRYFLDRWTYHWHDPKRSDIVVIKDPTDGACVVKRIIAMPGESVYFKDGQVYVNGKMLKEPYLAVGTSTSTNSRAREELIMCGKDQYYVLGDNRDNSYDSRIYGPVRRENILGSVMR
jgi:signal peptidase I